jgi:hypothetical protein
VARPKRFELLTPQIRSLKVVKLNSERRFVPPIGPPNGHALKKLVGAADWNLRPPRSERGGPAVGSAEADSKNICSAIGRLRSLLCRVQAGNLAFVTPAVTPSTFSKGRSANQFPDKSLILKLERVKGIEPSSSAWKDFAQSIRGPYLVDKDLHRCMLTGGWSNM